MIVTTVLYSRINQAVVTIRFFSPIFRILVYVLLFMAYAYMLVRLRQWYKKFGRCRYPYPSAQGLRYFLEANKLFETSFKEKIRDGRIEKEKIIVNSACLGCWEDEKEIVIRAYKNGDKFTDKMNDLDTGLCALLGLMIDNKIDNITHCDYHFKKIQDKRIIVKSKHEIEINCSVNLPLNNNLNWKDQSGQPGDFLR